MKQTMHSLMRELEEVRTELKGITMYARLHDDELQKKFKALESKENKLMKKLYHL